MSTGQALKPGRLPQVWGDHLGSIRLRVILSHPFDTTQGQCYILQHMRLVYLDSFSLFRSMRSQDQKKDARLTSMFVSIRPGHVLASSAANNGGDNLGAKLPKPPEM